MFHCEAYRCSMEERHCVAYQEAIRGRESATIHCGDAWGTGALTVAREKCVNCAQGAAIAAAYEPVSRPAGLPRRSGDIPPQEANKEEIMAEKNCIVPGCDKPVISRLLCANCYDKWRRGDAKVVQAKGETFNRVVPLQRRARPGKPENPEKMERPKPWPKPPKPETKPAKPETKPRKPQPKAVRAEVSKREQSLKGNGQIPVPEFEAKILYALARKTGGTVAEAFLRCLRRGLEHELGLL